MQSRRNAALLLRRNFIPSNVVKRLRAAVRANKNVYLLDTLREQDTHIPPANLYFPYVMAARGIIYRLIYRLIIAEAFSNYLTQK